MQPVPIPPDPTLFAADGLAYVEKRYGSITTLRRFIPPAGYCRVQMPHGGPWWICSTIRSLHSVDDGLTSDYRRVRRSTQAGRLGEPVATLLSVLSVFQPETATVVNNPWLIIPAGQAKSRVLPISQGEKCL